MARKLNKDNREGTIYYDKTAQKFIGEFRWKDNNGKYNRKKFSSKDKNTVIEKMEAFKKELKISDGRLNKSEITFEDFSESLMKTVFKERFEYFSIGKVFSPFGNSDVLTSPSIICGETIF